MQLIRQLQWALNSAACYASGGLPLVFYEREKNFGDELNHFLIPRIAQRKTFRVSAYLGPHVLGIGSILAAANKRSRVWGSGFLFKDDYFRGRPFSIHALRGKLSASLCSAHGITSVPLGDPALLLSQFHPKRLAPEWRLGVVPHFVEHHQFDRRTLENRGIRLIDMRSGVEAVIEAITECETIVSSSLHGLVVADSYSIPSVWGRFSGKPLGGTFKFLDYFSVFSGTTPEAPVDLTAELDGIEDLARSLARVRELPQGLHSSLLSAFPNI